MGSPNVPPKHIIEYRPAMQPNWGFSAERTSNQGNGPPGAIVSGRATEIEVCFSAALGIEFARMAFDCDKNYYIHKVNLAPFSHLPQVDSAGAGVANVVSTQLLAVPINNDRSLLWQVAQCRPFPI